MEKESREKWSLSGSGPSPGLICCGLQFPWAGEVYRAVELGRAGGKGRHNWCVQNEM